MTTPDEKQTITPYLIVRDAAGFLKFVTDVFAAELIMKVPAPEGGNMHMEMKIGTSTVMTANATDEYPPMPAGLYILVDDANKVYTQALAAGATSVMKPRATDYAKAAGGILDPFGNTWWITTPV